MHLNNLNAPVLNVLIGRDLYKGTQPNKEYFTNVLSKSFDVSA